MHYEIRKNFEEKASYFARSLPGMTVTERDSFLSVNCGLPSDTFNVTVVRDLSAPSELLTLGVDSFTSKGFPMALWYWESDVDNADISSLLQRRLTHAETSIAMYVDLSEIRQSSSSIEGLEITRVVTSSDLLHLGTIMLKLFGDSVEGRAVLAYYQRLSGHPLSAFPAMHFYLGTFHGMPISTGTLFVGSQTVGIYDIATLPEYRKRGIGSAMFQYLLDDACASPHRLCVLQASQEGYGIYLRAGFKPIEKVHVFENRGAL